jgi:hypothetical protein
MLLPKFYRESEGFWQFQTIPYTTTEPPEALPSRLDGINELPISQVCMPLGHPLGRLSKKNVVRSGHVFFRFCFGSKSPL